MFRPRLLIIRQDYLVADSPIPLPDGRVDHVRAMAAQKNTALGLYTS